MMDLGTFRHNASANFDFEFFTDNRFSGPSAALTLVIVHGRNEEQV